MPTKQSKDGYRRSGQGVAVPALQKPIVKNFDPPRPPYLSGAGGSPSSAADTNWSQRIQQVMNPEEAKQEDDTEEGECGCNSKGVCSCPRGSIIMKNEQLLRHYIRTSMVNEITAGEFAKGAGHLALDACGIIADLTGVGAAVGATCDAVNALSYAVEGRYLLAALSVISMIPVIGDVIGKGGKVGVWFTKAFPKTSSKIAKHGPDAIDKIRKLKTVIEANERLIEDFFKKISEDEKLKKLHPHIPKMQEALAVFMAEGMAEKELAAESLILHTESRIKENKKWFERLITEEVIDEDEEELDEDEIEEISGAAALGGGPALPLGMSTPTFGRKRKKKGSEVKGFSLTHDWPYEV